MDHDVNVKDLPSDLKPICGLAYYGYRLLFALPLIGVIAVIICATSSYNINVRKFARGYIWGAVIDLVILAVLLIIFYPYIETCIELFKSYIEQINAQ